MRNRNFRLKVGSASGLLLVSITLEVSKDLSNKNFCISIVKLHLHRSASHLIITKAITISPDSAKDLQVCTIPICAVSTFHPHSTHSSISSCIIFPALRTYLRRIVLLSHHLLLSLQELTGPFRLDVKGLYCSTI